MEYIRTISRYTFCYNRVDDRMMFADGKEGRLEGEKARSRGLYMLGQEQG